MAFLENGPKGNHRAFQNKSQLVSGNCSPKILTPLSPLSFYYFFCFLLGEIVSPSHFLDRLMHPLFDQGPCRGRTHIRTSGLINVCPIIPRIMEPFVDQYR